MGISVAYMGKLEDPGTAPAFIMDLGARAEAAGWRCKTMEVLIAEKVVSCPGLQGITLYPHRECEPMNFHVDAEGTFMNHTAYHLVAGTRLGEMMRDAFARSSALVLASSKRKSGKTTSKGKLVATIPDIGGEDFFRMGARYNFITTQYAGASVHAAVCALLRHVKDRYAGGLQIMDDTGYFDDGDYAKLTAEIARADRMTALAAEAFQAAAIRGPRSLDPFQDRFDEELALSKHKLH